MGFIFVVDTSLTMGLQLDGQPSCSVEDSRYGVASRIACGLIQRAKKMVPEPRISLYRSGDKVEKLATEVESAAAAQKMLANGVRLFGESHTGALLDRLATDLSPTPDDHIIVLTDATSYDCRFVIVNTTKNGMDPTQIEELEEVSAESCGYEVGEDYEDYYHLFYMSHDTSEESIVDAVAEEMFVVPVYSLSIGNLTATITTSPPIWEDRPFEIEAIGFCKSTNLQNIPVASNHFVLLENKRREIDVPMEEEENSQSGDSDRSRRGGQHILQLVAEAMKAEGMTATVRFGSGRFGILSTYSEASSGLLLSLLPAPALLPAYVPNFNILTVIPHQNDQYEDLVVKECDEPASHLANLHSWINSSGIQNDLGKILRYFRKLPDRVDQFYLELNRVRFYAAVIGCQQILQELAKMMREESVQLNEQVRRHTQHVLPFLDLDITQGNPIKDIPILH
ncbi:unnamed protein product, partial [Mesorhabditis spiculigera]